MIFYDTETCGLHGLAVLLQWAEDDGPVHLWNIWKEPVGETLDLIEYMMEREVCGFNLAFDHFHLCKIYTVFSMLDRDDIPEDNIEKIALLEPSARLGPCLKPKAALDLMLYARKGPYQSLMSRKAVVIRKIPTTLALPLQKELEQRITFDDILFARRKDKYAPKWRIKDRQRQGKDDPNFKDLVLKFHPKSGLKILAEHTGVAGKTALKFGDAGVPKYLMPKEYGWAPFALAVGSPDDWNKAWPEVIKQHIQFWAYNPKGREYAEDDVIYTRGLYNHWGKPAAGDVDSELTCMVGAVRWRGYSVSIPEIKELREIALEKSKEAPKDPKRSLAWILPHLEEIEKIALKDKDGNYTTKRVVLEQIAEWEGDTEHKHPIKGFNLHPAAVAARQVLDARFAKKEVELYDKIILAGRFHASFIVIGTLSSRMAGSDGLNPQGIKSDKTVRRVFRLADDGFQLSGGDFDAFEVTIADAVYDDPELRRTISTPVECDCEILKDGKCIVCGGSGTYIPKIHALFAEQLYPGLSYAQITETKGTEHDLYGHGKAGIFAMIYGGDDSTLVNKQGIDEDVAREAYLGFQRKYKGVARSRARIYDAFCSMRQPGGIGSKVVWHDPQKYVESMFGFRRYFDLENQICKALFDLAQAPPKEWKDIKIKVRRRDDRVQTAAGAVMSALYAAAFQIQASNMRAAANHEIQSPGAEVTKYTQNEIWKIQPHGVNDWLVVPMNVHDEVMCPNKCPELVEEKVLAAVENFRDKIPLIKIEWHQRMQNWAEK